MAEIRNYVLKTGRAGEALGCLRVNSKSYVNLVFSSPLPLMLAVLLHIDKQTGKKLGLTSTK